MVYCCCSRICNNYYMVYWSCEIFGRTKFIMKPVIWFLMCWPSYNAIKNIMGGQYANYYSNPWINYYENYTDNRFNYANRQNTYTIDRQIGDVNGDGVPDIVYLVGDKNQNNFYENIRLMIQDGSTLHWYVVPLYPDYSMAFDAWLFLGSFTVLAPRR